MIQGGGDVHVECYVQTLWCPLLFTHAHTRTSVMVRDHKCECFNFLVSTLAALTVFIGGLPELTIKARNFWAKQWYSALKMSAERRLPFSKPAIGSQTNSRYLTKMASDLHSLKIMPCLFYVITWAASYGSDDLSVCSSRYGEEEKLISSLCR